MTPAPNDNKDFKRTVKSRSNVNTRDRLECCFRSTLLSSTLFSFYYRQSHCMSVNTDPESDRFHWQQLQHSKPAAAEGRLYRETTEMSPKKAACGQISWLAVALSDWTGELPKKRHIWGIVSSSLEGEPVQWNESRGKPGALLARPCSSTGGSVSHQVEQHSKQNPEGNDTPWAMMSVLSVDCWNTTQSKERSY